jgi:hypothetical protein
VARIVGAAPPQLQLGGRAHVLGSERAVLRRVPLTRDPRVPRGKRAEPGNRTRNSAPGCGRLAWAVGTARACSLAHPGLPRVPRALRATPPDLDARAWTHALGSEGTVLRRVPLACDIRADRSERSLACCTPAGAEGTARAPRSVQHRGFPFVLSIAWAAPPHLSVAPAAHIARSERTVLGRVPLAREPGRVLGEAELACRTPRHDRAVSRMLGRPRRRSRMTFGSSAWWWG